MERHDTRLLTVLMLLFAAAWLPAGASEPGHVPGRLLVEAAPAADPVLVGSTLARHGARVRRHMRATRAAVLAVDEASSAAVAESLAATGLFRYVERDYYAHTARMPDDHLFQSQWHLGRIQATGAWQITTGAPGTVIAIVDSGVDPSHPDLASRLAGGWSFLKSSADFSDLLGHGTAVAGVAGAASNNAIGVAGVTWANRIMPLAVVDAQDRATYSDITSAIVYAADNGARVINISLGGANSSRTLQNAVDYAWSKGVLIFASAMNKSISTAHYPAACEGAVAVGATDSHDLLAGFSNFGRWIGLTAPGVSILSTSRGGGYGYWNGTSFASPIAAGVAALVFSVNPALTNAQALAIMKQNADDLGAPGFDEVFGWGRVNAAKAVRAALATLPGAAATTPLAVTPAHVNLLPAQSQQFAAGEAVTWTLRPAVGAISPSGVYTAPPDIGVPVTVTITASSTTGPGRSASATVALTPPPPVDRGEGAHGRRGPGQTR